MHWPQSFVRCDGYSVQEDVSELCVRMDSLCCYLDFQTAQHPKTKDLWAIVLGALEVQVYLAKDPKTV